MDEQIRGNEYQLSLIGVIGSAVAVLITLAQLASTNRLDKHGPAWLDPAAITCLIVGGVFLGLAYGNKAYALAQLRHRRATGEVAADAAVPRDIHVTGPQVELIVGTLVLCLSVAFFLAFMWT